MGCAGQRQPLQSLSSDDLESSETRHQFQAEFFRRPFRRGGHSLATGRPPLPKRLLSGRQSKVLQRPRKYDPAATTAGTRGTEVEDNSRKQQTWNQSPKGMTKHRQSQKSRKTKGSKARTPSQNLWGQTPKQLVNSQEPSFRKATTSQHQAGTVQECPTSLPHGTRHRLPTVRPPGCPDAKAIRL